MLDQSKLKAFADNKINKIMKLKFDLERVVYLMGKGEDIGYHSIISAMFSKGFFTRVVNMGLFGQRVNGFSVLIAEPPQLSLQYRRFENRGHWFEPSARPVFLMIVIAIHSSRTAVRCFDNSYVGKQPVDWKEYCAEFWLKDL